jgi:hypothetical protein
VSHSHDDSHSGSTNGNGSPASASCVTEDPTDLKQKLKDLEAVMLGTDTDPETVDSLEIAIADRLSVEPEEWKNNMVSVPRGDLKELLIATPST